MRDQKGQALIEMAFSIILLLVMVFGITEFGRYFFYRNTANNAARDGVRWAVTHAVISNWCAEVKQHVVDTYKDQFVPKLTTGDITVLVDEGACTQPSNGSGSRVHVIVSRTFTVLTGTIIPFFNNSSSPLTKGDASMRYEL